MRPTSRRRLVLVLSGPSGVGKSTVAARLLADPAFGRAVTATTRPPRPGEADGAAYHFLSDAAFEEGLRRDRFLESAEVYGRRYGTPVESVERVLDTGKVCVLVIDVQGAATLRARRDGGSLGFEAVLVFLEPPSIDALLARLQARGTESAADLAQRKLAIEHEMARACEFDHVVVNDDLDTAVASLRNFALHPRAQ